MKKNIIAAMLCILAFAGCSGLFGEKENGKENDLSVEEICEKIDGIFNDLESYLETEFNSDYSDKNAVMTAVKEWLASEEYVSNIEMEGDSCIVVTFPDGQKSSIEYPTAIDGNVSSYPDSLFTQDFLQDIPELTGGGTSTPSGPETKASSTSDKALFNKLFFVLWEPFKNEGISDELFVDDFMKMKNIYYKHKEIYKNEECTLKSLRDIGGLYSVPFNNRTVYWTPSVIVIATHGQGGKIIQTVYNENDYNTLCYWWYEKKHEKDFNKIRSLVFSEEKIGSGKKTRISYRLNIPCDYLKENLTQINNSIVFLNNCESMPYEEYGMASAFRDNGASTVFGYKQKVDNFSCHINFYSILNYMLTPPKKNDTPHSALFAYHNLKQKEKKNFNIMGNTGNEVRFAPNVYTMSYSGTKSVTGMGALHLDYCDPTEGYEKVICGLVYGTDEESLHLDSETKAGFVSTEVDHFVEDGEDFFFSFENLKPNTEYFYRAFLAVRYKEGILIHYADEIETYVTGEDPEPEPDPIDPDTIIYYTTNDGNPAKYSLRLANSDMKLINEDFENGVGTLYFESQVTSIPGNMFLRASNMDMISIPESVTFISGNSFEECISLKDFHIPDKVTGIDVYAFKESGLEKIHIPEKVETIGGEAFSNCLNLKEVEIDASSLTLRTGVFKGCSNLEKIRINKDLVQIYDDVFRDCSGCLTYAGNTFKHELLRFSNISELIFETSVTKIPYCSCSTVGPVEKITIKGNPQLDRGAFGFYYTSLKSVIFESNDFNTLSQEAFYGCSSLEKITLPAGITRINTRVFAGCTSLTDVVFNGNITSIDDFAFKQCSSLKRINLGNYVESIGIGAFQECSSLYNMELPRYLKSLGNEAFKGCSSLESVTLPTDSGFTQIEYGTFAECTSLKEIVFPDNIKVISTSGPYGYYKQYSTMGGCTSLKRAVLPNGLTSIQPYLFYGCSSLTDVEIGPNVTSIGKGAFQDCSSLSTITLPGTVTSIGGDCFSGCTELKTVYCNSITPPAAPGIGIPKSAIIYVPYNSVESYKNHIYWGGYTILPMP